MTVLTLLAAARRAGLTVQAQGDQLLVRGPRTAEALAQRLLAAKPMVLVCLRSESAPRPRRQLGRWDPVGVLRLVSARLRAVARAYRPASRLVRAPAAAAALARLDTVLTAAIDAESIVAVEAALTEYEQWWGARIAGWAVDSAGDRR